MDIVKSNGVPTLKVDGDIKFERVGGNTIMDVRAYIVAPNGSRQIVGIARFEYVDPQILRSLLKFASEGRERQYGNVVSAVPR